MLNILIPLAGKSTFAVTENNPYPKILSDVEGKLLIERAAQPFCDLGEDKRITVVIPQEQIVNYKLDNVIGLLNASVDIFTLTGDTQGAACSCLLAIESLDLDSPLIISSFEQVLELDLGDFLSEFERRKVDAGVLTFEAIHPKWSFVKTNSEGYVVQSAEKNPISKQAVAGFYYFRKASGFVEAAKQMIRKDVNHNGMFFVSPCLNEIILNEGKVLALPIDKSRYFHIQDQHALEMYEDRMALNSQKSKALVRERTEEYIKAFNAKSLLDVAAMMAPDVHLVDPTVSIRGRDNVVDYIKGIFNDHDELEFKSNSIVCDGYRSVIEFDLQLGAVHLIGTDVICWNSDGQMISLDAYLYEVTDGKS